MSQKRRVMQVLVHDLLPLFVICEETRKRDCPISWPRSVQPMPKHGKEWNSSGDTVVKADLITVGVFNSSTMAIYLFKRRIFWLPCRLEIRITSIFEESEMMHCVHSQESGSSFPPTARSPMVHGSQCWYSSTLSVTCDVSKSKRVDIKT